MLESSFNYLTLGVLFFISNIMNFCLRLILNLLYFLTGSKIDEINHYSVLMH